MEAGGGGRRCSSAGEEDDWVGLGVGEIWSEGGLSPDEGNTGVNLLDGDVPSGWAG